MSLCGATGATSNLISRAPAGITQPYQGSSFAVKALIVVGTSLAIYNALELIILAFGTFKRYNSVYFKSFLASSIGIIPYSIGLLFKSLGILRDFRGTYRWISLVLITTGWRKILQYTKWMIIINSIILFIPTTVVEFGAFGDLDTDNFATAYNIMEKIQITGFFIQEVILSSIYIVEAMKIFRASLHHNTRGLMYQLTLINIIVIIMDMGLLAMEYASLFLVQAISKGVFYSIKLKLELAILNRLVKFNPPLNCTFTITNEVEFPRRSNCNATRTVQFTAPFDYFGAATSANIASDYAMNFKHLDPSSSSVNISEVMDIQAGRL
ncbi:hypothetical protein V496_02931 [Pseudogymnoascus sp. VKM F-4515 (FW-2607)]|nr:hypothetical protein V496_02931 [Pseudogymnoascus sp. VKM F-4515 (FW-2607)]